MLLQNRLSSLNQYDMDEAIKQYKATMRSNWESSRLGDEAIFGVLHTPTSTRWVPMLEKSDRHAVTVADFQLQSEGSSEPALCRSMDDLSEDGIFDHPELGPIPAFTAFTVQNSRPEAVGPAMEALSEAPNLTGCTEYTWDPERSTYMARPSSAWLVAANWTRLRDLNPDVYSHLPVASMDAKSLVPAMLPSDQVAAWTVRANALIAKLKSLKAATEGGSQGGESDTV